jgi:hypothetical protein
MVVGVWVERLRDGWGEGAMRWNETKPLAVWAM